jgi:NAD(P)-dependent dehydrogenase (short-subunit alcohol dehydrogenase family)
VARDAGCHSRDAAGRRRPDRQHLQPGRAGRTGEPRLYSAAKGGWYGLTSKAAFTYATDNILINAIAPGTIDTPILADITPEMREANANSHLIKRLGRPEEIAGMMAYCFSGDGDFTTGLTFPWTAAGRSTAQLLNGY